MNTKHLHLVAIALLTAGCAGMPGAGGKRVSAALACPSNCQVTVTVADGCVVQSASPDPIYAMMGNPAIRWTISGPAQYTFAQGNGIVFPPAKNAGKTAPFTGTPGGGRTVVLNDRNTGPADHGPWAYEINVTDGTRTCRLDPTVINDDGSTTLY
jgi:hypothetical protein